LRWLVRRALPNRLRSVHSVSPDNGTTARHPALGGTYMKEEVKTFLPRGRRFFVADFFRGVLPGTVRSGLFGDSRARVDLRFVGRSVVMSLLGWACFQRVTEAARHLSGTLSWRSMKILGRSQIGGGGFIHAQDLSATSGGSVPPRELRRTPVEPIPLRRTAYGGLHTLPVTHSGRYSLPFFHMPHNVVARLRATLRRALEVESPPFSIQC